MMMLLNSIGISSSDSSVASSKQLLYTMIKYGTRRMRENARFVATLTLHPLLTVVGAFASNSFIFSLFIVVSSFVLIIYPCWRDIARYLARIFHASRSS